MPLTAGASTRVHPPKLGGVSEPALSSARPGAVGSRRATRNVVDSPPSRGRGSRGRGPKGREGGVRRRWLWFRLVAAAVVARAGRSRRASVGWRYAWRNVVTSYARLHFGDAPELAQHFVDACRAVPAGAAEAALKAASAMRKTPPSTQGSVPSTPQLGRVASTDSLQLQMQLQHTSSEGSLSGGGGHGPGDGSGDATPAGAGTPSNKSGYAGSWEDTRPGGSRRSSRRAAKIRPAHRRARATTWTGAARWARARARWARASGRADQSGCSPNLPAARIRLLRRGLSDAGNSVRRTASSAA